MSTAYRDDLEAAIQLASELDRECTSLRTRNAELAALVPTDARENQQRLELALVRESAERARHELDERDREIASLRKTIATAPARERRREVARDTNIFVNGVIAGGYAGLVIATIVGLFLMQAQLLITAINAAAATTFGVLGYRRRLLLPRGAISASSTNAPLAAAAPPPRA